jgi:hypothetical protein
VDDAGTVWPDLPYGSWRKTAATLQLHPDRGQGEPGSFLLGQLRSRGDPFFRADRPAPPGGVPGLPDAVTREAYSHPVPTSMER